jgi:hypothetical protein
MSLHYDRASRWQPGHYICDDIALPDGTRITPSDPPVTLRAREATFAADRAITSAIYSSRYTPRRYG